MFGQKGATEPLLAGIKGFDPNHATCICFWLATMYCVLIPLGYIIVNKIMTYFLLKESGLTLTTITWWMEDYTLLCCADKVSQ